MEDVAPYSDDQVATAAREVHEKTHSRGVSPPFCARARD